MAGRAAVSVAVGQAEERSTHVTVWLGEGHAVVGIIGEREPPVVAPNAAVRPCHQQRDPLKFLDKNRGGPPAKLKGDNGHAYRPPGQPRRPRHP
eukprot:COSAG01_NODE_9341_length_2478_cov_1.635982_1_plen_94_part_00